MTSNWTTQFLAAAAFVVAGTIGLIPSASADVFDKAWQGIVTATRLMAARRSSTAAATSTIKPTRPTLPISRWLCPTAISVGTR